MDAKLDEIHPGEILNEEFLKPLGITTAQLATALDVAQSKIQEIVECRAPITAEMAVRLSVYFRADVRFWMNMQQEYDIRTAEANLLPQLKKKLKPHAPDLA